MAAMYRTAFVIMLLFSIVKSKDEDDNHHEIDSYYMSSYCGKTFSMAQKNMNEMMLELSETDEYENNMDCEIKIVTSPNNFLFFNFMRVDLDDCDDWVRLYAETTFFSDAISPTICKEKDDVYTTPGNTGILKFRSDVIFNQGSFKIHITSFYKPTSGKCMSGDFKCTKKNRCIKSSLECNSRDNCGDDSDEHDDCDENWWIYLLVGLGVFFAMVAIVAIIVCIVCHKKKGQKGRVHATKTEKPRAPNQAFTMGYSGTTVAPSSTNHPTGHPASVPPPPYSSFGNTSSGYSSDLIPPPAIYVPPYTEKY